MLSIVPADARTSLTPVLRSESGDIPLPVWSLPLSVTCKDEQIENF
jgi:hypothetical protein